MVRLFLARRFVFRGILAFGILVGLDVRMRRRFVVVLGLRLVLFGFFDACADQLPGLLDELPQFVAQGVVFAKKFGDQVAGPLQDVGDGGQAPLSVHKFGGPRLQVGGGGLGGHDFLSQRIQAAAAGQSGQRLFLRLEGQVQIFQPPQGVGRLDMRRQFAGQSALRFERLQNPLFAVGQRAQPVDRLLDSPDLFLVQSTGLVLSEPGDKRDRIAVIQQLDRDLNFVQGQGDFTRDLPKINLNHRFHSRPAGGC
jgi:hypothetical protein